MIALLCDIRVLQPLHCSDCSGGGLEIEWKHKNCIKHEWKREPELNNWKNINIFLFSNWILITFIDSQAKKYFLQFHFEFFSSFFLRYSDLFRKQKLSNKAKQQTRELARKMGCLLWYQLGRRGEGGQRDGNC